jgi:hypothetical protein
MSLAPSDLTTQHALLTEIEGVSAWIHMHPIDMTHESYVWWFYATSVDGSLFTSGYVCFVPADPMEYELLDWEDWNDIPF